MAEMIEINAELIHETDDAYLIDDAGKRVWLPISQVEYDGKVTFEMPLWLAKEKDLV